MEIAEVAELFKAIKERYSNFDASIENVHKCFKYLEDFPYAIAIQNLDNHIKTTKWEPKIADIRGGLGDVLDSERSKREADVYFDKVDHWCNNSAPPPEGYWDSVRAKLRGDSR